MSCRFPLARSGGAAVACAFAATFLSAPAHAVLIPDPSPAEEILSALAIDRCLQRFPAGWRRAACLLIIADPPASGLTEIHWAARFDPDAIEIAPTPLFFGDFSLSGNHVVTGVGVPGGLVPLAPDPGFAEADHLDPRSLANVTFLVDNVNGLLELHMDMSANPLPVGAIPQNFFGFFVQATSGRVEGIEYFASAGRGHFGQESLACRAGPERIGCGSDAPVGGWWLATIPEPATWAMLVAGFGVVGWTARRRTRAAVG